MDEHPHDPRRLSDLPRGANPSPTQLVASIGRDLFGDDWAAPLARLAATNVRTMQRIRGAITDGADYPAAKGVLAALADRLGAYQRVLAPYRRKPADRPQRPENQPPG